MSTDTILKQALSGRVLSDIKIIDDHGHLDLWKAWFPFGSQAEAMVAQMDRIGIDQLCINKWNCPDIELANRDVAQALKTYPDRFIGFAATAPCLGREKNTAELTRCFDEWGFRGIKVHEGYERLAFRDQWSLPEYRDAMEAIWEFASARRCPVLCHGFLTPDIAKRYPEANFLLAHACGERSFANLYREYPNVYFDTANSVTLHGNIEYFIKTVGCERICYGSDMPFANPAYRLGQVVGADIDDEQLRKILGGNFAKVLQQVR